MGSSLVLSLPTLVLFVCSAGCGRKSDPTTSSTSSTNTSATATLDTDGASDSGDTGSDGCGTTTDLLERNGEVLGVEYSWDSSWMLDAQTTCASDFNASRCKLRDELLNIGQPITYQECNIEDTGGIIVLISEFMFDPFGTGQYCAFRDAENVAFAMLEYNPLGKICCGDQIADVSTLGPLPSKLTCVDRSETYPGYR